METAFCNSPPLQTNGLECIFSKMSEQDLEKSAGFVVQLRGFQEFCNSKLFSENSTVFEISIVLKFTFHKHRLQKGENLSQN